jgi:hypothetical protein
MFITLINYFHFALVGIKLITIFALVTNTNTMKKIIKMSVKLKLVDEINALEKRCIGESFTWSELKQISKEIESKLEYFTEGEKEIFFNGRYKEEAMRW